MANLVSKQQQRLQSRALYEANQKEANSLKADWQDYFFQVQAYFYTTAELSVEMEEVLADLIRDLKQAEKNDIPPAAYFQSEPYPYARKLLREFPVKRYDQEASSALRMLGGIIGLAIFVYTLYMFLQGLFGYKSLHAAFNMPVGISILGLPLQLVMVMTFIFCIVRYVQKSACGKQLDRGKNLLYLLGALLVLCALAIIPYYSLRYNVFVMKLPVWLIALIYIFYFLFRFGRRYVTFDSLVDAYFLRKSSASSAPDPKEEPKPSLEESAASKKKGPLINREVYREAQQNKTKEK